jgi:hypothetical protein
MAFGSLLRKVGKAAATLSKSPLGRVAGLVPGLGTVVSGIGLAGTAYGAYSALSSKAGPSLPAMPGGMMMPVSGGFAGQAGPGDRSILRNDPNVVEALKAHAIPMRGLRSYYRAPKGYVVVRDNVGDPMGIPKFMAKQYFGWKPAKKPLLSIRDTSALKRAGTAIKKLQNAEKMARKIANWKTPSRRERVTVIQQPGPLKIGRKVA